MNRATLLFLIGALALPWPVAAQSGPPSNVEAPAEAPAAPLDTIVDPGTPSRAFKPVLGDLLGNGVHTYVSVAPEWTIWEPGIKSVQPSILGFSGQGFTGLRFSAGVGVGVHNLALFNYSRPFIRSIEQSGVIETGGNSGMEKLQVIGNLGGYLSLLRVLDESPLFQTIGSLSVGYTRETFVGKATAKTDAKMLNYGAQLVPNNRGGYSIANLAQGLTDIRSGSQYKFRSDFKDFEASIDILPLLAKQSASNEDIEVRIGGYWSEWARPAELGSGVTFTTYSNSYPLVYEAKYRTKGILLSVGDKSPNSEFDYTFGLRIGIDDDIQTGFPGLLKSSHPQFVGLQAKIGYNIKMISSRYGEVYFTPSASLDYRNFMETTRDASGNTTISDKILDGEKIYKFYGRLWVKF